MTKLKAMTKKQWYAFIAILVAVCILVPSIAIGVHVMAAGPKLAKAIDGKNVKELVTSKTATPNGDGSYHVKIDAYNTAYSIQNVPSDTVLVLEHSGKMSETLGTRDYTNLKTYATFSPHALTNNNDMYDDDNPYNDLTLGISIPINNTYADNKYIEDPNNPGTFIYFAQRFEGKLKFLPPGYTCDYYYSFADISGNVYESERIRQSIVGSGWDAIFGGSSLDKVELSWKYNFMDDPNNEIKTGDYDTYVEKTGKSGIKRKVVVNTIYTRNNDNATNASLYKAYRNNGNKLYIMDDYGQLCPVTIDVTRINNPSGSGTHTAYYTYSVTDSKGHQFRNSYGNPMYGAEYSVFQGFKTYNKDGSIDHKHSIEHKTLYSNQRENVTKLLAMQEAVEDFVLKVHKTAYDNHLTNGEQRIGIVSYANTDNTRIEVDNNTRSRIEYYLTDVYDERNANAMLDTVYSLTASGARRLDLGTYYADDVLEGVRDGQVVESLASDKSHNVSVIDFTTGLPVFKEGDVFSMDIANASIGNSAWAKRNYNAKIYTIGMYELADPGVLHGDYFYRWLHSNIPCDGKKGSFWGGTALSGLSNDGMEPRDAAATNRLLNYMSSNYGKDVTRLGLEGPKWLSPNDGSWSTGGTGYEITAAPEERVADGYYFSAYDTNELLKAFDNIAETVQVPLSTLGTDTQLVDHVSDYFKISGPVSAYTLNYKGSGSFESEDNWSKRTSLSAEVNGSDITVTGFDYATNYCASGHSGKKLVVEFDIRPIDGFLGGRDVPTNLRSSSVIDGNGSTVENLPYPQVDVDLVNDCTPHDEYVYYTKEADLAKLFEVSPHANGLTNDFVNLKYELLDPDAAENAEPVMTYTVRAGADSGESSLEGENKVQQYPVLDRNKTYVVRATVSALGAAENDATAVNVKTGDATVYIYKPTVAVKDSTVTPGNGAKGVDLNDNRVSVTWSAEGTDHAAPDEGAPSLSYTFYDRTKDPQEKTPIPNPSAYRMVDTTDYNVDVTVKGHPFSYETTDQAYLKTDGSTVLVSEYKGDKNDLVPVTYTSQDPKTGEETTQYLYDDDGNMVYRTTMVAVTKQRSQPDRKDSVDHFTTYENQSDNTKTKETPDGKEGRLGNFTIYTGKSYDLYLQKVFSGPYADPEGVVFTLTGSDGSSQTVTFDPDADFDGQTSKVKKANAKLRSAVTYTLEEGFTNENEEPARYETTATQQLTPAGAAAGEVNPLADTDANDGVAKFEFTVDGAALAESADGDKLNIVVTNTDTQEVPPQTGVSEDNSHHGWLWAAIAGTAFLISGAGVYEFRRKKHGKA